MTTQPNPEGDVPKDQTPKPGNVDPRTMTGLPVQDQALYDMFVESETPEETPAETPEKKPDETPATPEEKPTPPVTPETKPNETPPEADQPFAVLGDQTFKTKEEMIEFVKKTQGYNRFVTGNLKKVHPDWFGEDGKLISAKMEEFKKAADAAATTVDDTKEVKPLSDAEKKKLRDVGFVFREDLPPAKETKEHTGDLEKFEKDHPSAKDHRDQILSLIEATKDLDPSLQLDVESAWLQVKRKEKIVEDGDQKTYAQGLAEGKKKQSLDNAVPSSTGGGTGVPPVKSDHDDMDVILGAGGLL